MSSNRRRQLNERPIVCDRCRHVCSLATVYVPEPGVVPEDPHDMWATEATDLLREGNFACLECYLQYVQAMPMTSGMRLIDVRTLDELEMVLLRVQRKLRTGPS